MILPPHASPVDILMLIRPSRNEPLFADPSVLIRHVPRDALLLASTRFH